MYMYMHAYSLLKRADKLETAAQGYCVVWPHAPWQVFHMYMYVISHLRELASLKQLFRDALAYLVPP